MQTYDIGLVPGPVSVPPELRATYQINYGSSDLEDEFFAFFNKQISEGLFKKRLNRYIFFRR